MAVIEGSDETARGVVQLKDLILGAKIAENATLEEWKERPSQVEVARADLVAEVRRMLDRPRMADHGRGPRRGAAPAGGLRGARRAVGSTPPILQPAETLLDLYGEDIRARAYVTHDPVLGEAMLRPDFTVPVVQMHMDERRRAGALHLCRRGVPHAGGGRAPGAGIPPGRLRAVRPAPTRPRADAEVFALIAEALAPLRAAGRHRRYRPPDRRGERADHHRRAQGAR